MGSDLASDFGSFVILNRVLDLCSRWKRWLVGFAITVGIPISTWNFSLTAYEGRDRGIGLPCITPALPSDRIGKSPVAKPLPQSLRLRRSFRPMCRNSWNSWTRWVQCLSHSQERLSLLNFWGNSIGAVRVRITSCGSRIVPDLAHGTFMPAPHSACGWTCLEIFAGRIFLGPTSILFLGFRRAIRCGLTAGWLILIVRPNRRKSS